MEGSGEFNSLHRSQSPAAISNLHLTQGSSGGDSSVHSAVGENVSMMVPSVTSH